MNYTTSSQLISERNLKLLKFVPQSKMASELNVGQSKSEEYMNGFLRKNTEFKVHRRNVSDLCWKFTRVRFIPKYEESFLC